MDDKPKPADQHDQADDDGCRLPINEECSASPQESTKTNRHISKPTQAAKNIIRRFTYIFAFLDSHDGAITAIATIVIAVLTYFIAHDGAGQRRAIQGQLSEMKKQRLASIAQTRANPLRDYAANAVTQDRKLASTGESIIGFEFSPYWDNRGGTEAREFRGWFDLKVFDIGAVVPRSLSGKNCPDLVTPNPLPNESTIFSGRWVALLAKFVSVADAQATMGDNASKFILMWGHAEWKDIYFPETPNHTDDWCVHVAPNDLRQSKFSYISLIDKIR